MSNNQNPPGLMLPTQKPYTPGAGNPRDSALLAGQNMNIKQANLNASVGGKKRKHKGGGDVVVPQFQMQYTAAGGPGSNPNDQIKNLSSTGMQTTSWSANDNNATKMGGTRRKTHKKGGKSNLNWGCYSGGKKRRMKHRKTRRISKRSKRHY